MAKILYDDPDGVTELEVPADRVSDSGRVEGIRVRREDESYLHLPYERLYSVETSEEEGKVDYSSR